MFNLVIQHSEKVVASSQELQAPSAPAARDDHYNRCAVHWKVKVYVKNVGTTGICVLVSAFMPKIWVEGKWTIGHQLNDLSSEQISCFIVSNSGVRCILCLM